MSSLSSIFDGVIEEVPTVLPPIAVLKELAQEFNKRTNGLLVGEIKQSNYSNRFSIDFNIIAYSLNQYSYRVFSIEHDLNFYPLTVINATGKNEKVGNQEDLERILKNIFSSPEVKKVINGLLAQVKSS